MEESLVLIALLVLGTLIVLPIWIISSLLRLRRDVENERHLNSQHWQDITARLLLLETRFKEAREATTVKTQQESRAATPEVPIVTAPVSAPTIPAPIISAASRPPVPEPAHSTPEPAIPRPLPPVIPYLKPPVPPVPKPIVREPATPASRGFDLEEMLGTNWLNKIGISILVLGLAFFLAYQLQNLGPSGKVLLGIGLSTVMIAIGVRYESNERYRILARASAAGGWALLYFVSYAVYHVPAAHVIDSRELDFFLMLAVAAAIVWYSLRYRSQATTALALVLSYLTVGIHHTSVYSLAASVILALIVVALALRMKWFALELFGILATYFNHFLWIWPVVDALGPHRMEFPEFRTSVALLAFYWLLFRFSYIYRNISDQDQERLSIASALTNGFCLLAVLKYQSVHPEWAFGALLVLGTVELILAVLAARRRRTAFIVLATLGSALLIAALPFRYSGASLSLLWLVAAETFLLAGVFLREIIFRRIGMITSLVVAAQMVFDTSAPLLETRFVTNVGVLPAYSAAVLFVSGAVLCYFNSHWVRIRWQALFEHEFDSAIVGSLTYVGGLLLLLAAWFACPGVLTAVVWAALALALNLAASLLDRPPLAVQGNVIAVLAIIRLITLNLFSTDQWHGISLRLLTVGGTALLLYASAPFARAVDSESDGQWSWFMAAYTWAASILIGVLLWYEMSSVNIVLGWMALGIILLEIGLQMKAGFLRWQGYMALGASFLQLFAANLDVSIQPGQISSRIMHVLPLIAAYFYADWRLRWAGDSSKRDDLKRAGTIFSYCGVISATALLYFEVTPSWVAAAWAALALAMITAAYFLKRCDFLHHSFLLVAAVAFRVVTYNFFQPMSTTSFWQSERYYAGAAIALLFAGLPLAFVIRQSGFGTEQARFLLDSRPEQAFFFVPCGLLTALIGLESTRGQMTVNWGIEGLAIFLLALLAGERSFRLTGLGLLLLCVAKIFLIDVWGLDPQSRYITLIILGAALVLVSFLYTRHKEKFQRYL